MIVIVTAESVNIPVNQRLKIKTVIKGGIIFGVLCGTDQPVIVSYRNIIAIELSEDCSWTGEQ